MSYKKYEKSGKKSKHFSKEHSPMKSMIKAHQFKMSHSLGQNFLKDDFLVEQIVDVSGVSDGDVVIEIGPGMGAMTSKLLERCMGLYAIEIDARLYPILKGMFLLDEKFHLVEADFLKIELSSFIERIKTDYPNLEHIRVVANLPYYVSTPIMMKLLEETHDISSMTLMLQKEVAHRIASAPNSKEYGVLSIMSQLYCNAEVEFDVPKEAFIPMPNVDSAIINLEFKEPDERLAGGLLEDFKSIVRAGFAQRRKTLVNSLFASSHHEKEVVTKILEENGISINARAENLSVDDFIRLTEGLCLGRQGASEEMS